MAFTELNSPMMINLPDHRSNQEARVHRECEAIHSERTRATEIQTSRGDLVRLNRALDGGYLLNYLGQPGDPATLFLVHMRTDPGRVDLVNTDAGRFKIHRCFYFQK